MPRGKKFTADQITGKLREAEVGFARGKTVPEVVRKLGVTPPASCDSLRVPRRTSVGDGKSPLAEAIRVYKGGCGVRTHSDGSSVSLRGEPPSFCHRFSGVSDKIVSPAHDEVRESSETERPCSPCCHRQQLRG
jgi:hypothetical protein